MRGQHVRNSTFYCRRAKRFGALPENIENSLSQIKDVHKLDFIFEKSITVTGIDEIGKLVSEITNQ